MQDETRMQIEEGRFHFKSHNYKKAEEIFKNVLTQKKDFADLHNYLGLIAHEDGRYSEAMESFKSALKVNPRYTEAMLNLSILYNDVGEYDKAKKLVHRSRKDARKTKTSMDPFIRSKLANKHAEVGDWYRGVGAYEQAIEEYRKALELEDCYVDIRTKMAICLRELGDKKTALEELKRATKDSTYASDAFIQLGVTYYALGKKSEARHVWKDVVKKFPANQTAKMYLRFTEAK